MARLREPLVLALDVGTSSVRALLHDGGGAPVEGSASHHPYVPDVKADGTAEVSAEQLLRLTERAVDDVLRGCRQQVAAVGISTFWHGLLGLRGGRPATPLLLWSDSRSHRQAEELARRPDASEIRQRTGCPIHPSYWPAKLAWAGAASAERWCSFGDLLLERWCGDFTTSLSMASATGICRLRRPGWDAEMLDLLGLRPEQLPEIADEPRRLAPRLARRWPPLAGARLVPAAGDGALANLGSDCVDPSQRAVTIGTSAAIRVMTETLPRRLPEGLWCYRLDGRRFILGGSFSNGGNLHAWVLDNFRASAEQLERRVARMPPAGHGLVFLPLLAGERSPGFAARATGAIAGLTLATTAADIMRAGMEGIALSIAGVDGRLDQAAPGAERLVASGVALLSSRSWMQILADCVGKPVRRSRYEESSSRGAALLALEHLGVRIRRRLPAGGTFSPDPAAHRVYAAEMGRQERLYQALVVDRLVDAGAPAHMRLRGRKR